MAPTASQLPMEGTDWVSRKSSGHPHNTAKLPAARVGAPLPCARTVGGSAISSSPSRIAAVSGTATPTDSVDALDEIY
eukprot:COSAG03_NODE_543_length_7031_cov_4.570831_9_plen_78_part_00